MGSELRHQKLSLKEELEQNAHEFSFEMAAYILEYNSDVSFGKETSVWQAPFRTYSINTFCLRGTEIEKITKRNDTHIVFIERLSIAGLNAPLPTPYAELMYRRSTEKDTSMQTFLNIFNTRLLGLSYQISKKRYLCLQNHSQKNCMLVKSIAAFAGENPDKMNRYLSRLTYLFWLKEKNAAGLEAIISSVFQFQTRVKQFHEIKLDIEENNTLGTMLLGKHSALGQKSYVSSFCINIELTHKNFEHIDLLMSDKNYFNKMLGLIKKYLGEFISVYIKITPQNVPIPYLKKEKQLILGKSAWLHSKNKIDTAVIRI